MQLLIPSCLLVFQPGMSSIARISRLLALQWFKPYSPSYIFWVKSDNILEANSKIITFIVRLASLLSASLNVINLIQGEHPQISRRIGVGNEISGC